MAASGGDRSGRLASSTVGDDDEEVEEEEEEEGAAAAAAEEVDRLAGGSGDDGSDDAHQGSMGDGGIDDDGDAYYWTCEYAASTQTPRARGKSPGLDCPGAVHLALCPAGHFCPTPVEM